jgi:hypothetical protein
VAGERESDRDGGFVPVVVRTEWAWGGLVEAFRRAWREVKDDVMFPKV